MRPSGGQLRDAIRDVMIVGTCCTATILAMLGRVPVGVGIIAIAVGLAYLALTD